MHDMDRRIKVWLISLYLFGAIVTYGHAWANVKPLGESSSDRAMNRLFLTVLGSAFWPLYISTALFEKDTQ